LLPAVVISTLVNGTLFGLLFLVPSGLGKADDAMEKVPAPVVETKAADQEQRTEEAPLTTRDVDEDAQAVA
jgi:hypothetical protein